MSKDSQFKRLKRLFSSAKKEKHVLQSTMAFGSFNEHGGGFSSRLFQPNFLIDSCAFQQQFNHSFNAQKGREKTIDIDVAHYRTIPFNQKHNFIDISNFPGYVSIKASPKILEKIARRVHQHRDSSKMKHLLTKDKYLSSFKFQDKPQKKDKSINYWILNKILQEDLFRDYSEKKINSLIENNFAWIEKSRDVWITRVNKVKLLRTLWWPEYAQEWKTRPRVWPSPKFIEQISRFVFLKPTKVENRFKYWFGHIERTLAGLRTQEQNFNYLLLKIIFYRHLKPLSPAALHSFQIKSIMLFTCERFPPSHPWWSDINEDKDSMIRHMLQQLLEAFQQNFLANYFLPEVNVLKNLSSASQSKVVDVLNQMLQTKNILLLLPTKDIERVVSVLGRFKVIIKRLDEFAVNTLSDGVLNTISNNPQLWMSMSNNKGSRKNKQSSIIMKMFYVFVFTLTFLFLCFILCFLKKVINNFFLGGN